MLGRQPTDPKLDAVLYFLRERGWLDLGCIIFSQYYDTAYWVAQGLTARLKDERVALYAGAGKSGIFFAGEWRSVEREDIKRAVRDRTIRLVVATDAACEGLNLQTLGTLINVDLPWNPSRLEQRIGRIKRFGQARDRVDMLNLVYHDTHDEKVYRALSQRMRDRYDLFGSLPDTIEDDWIEDIENLDEYLSQFTEKKTGQCLRPAIRQHGRAERPRLGAVRAGAGTQRCYGEALRGMVNNSFCDQFGDAKGTGVVFLTVGATVAVLGPHDEPGKDSRTLSPSRPRLIRSYGSYSR